MTAKSFLDTLWRQFHSSRRGAYRFEDQKLRRVHLIGVYAQPTEPVVSLSQKSPEWQYIDILHIIPGSGAITAFRLLRKKASECATRRIVLGLVVCGSRRFGIQSCTHNEEPEVSLAPERTAPNA
jgi:hypothetical protein